MRGVFGIVVGVALVHPVMGQERVPSAFDGFYVAGGGSYGVSTSRNFNFSEMPTPTGGGPSFSGTNFPSGWSGTVIAGYNLTFNGFVFGIEADSRWGREGAEQSRTQNFGGTFSFLVGTASGTYELRNDIGIHLSLRAGAFIGDTLIYGKVGAGTSRFIDTFNIDGSGVSFCPLPSFFPCPVPFQSGAGVGSFTSEKWMPSLVFGVGIEQNFNRFFLRLSAEAETIGPHILTFGPIPATGTGTFSGNASSDTFWTGRAQGAIGFRF